MSVLQHAHAAQQRAAYMGFLTQFGHKDAMERRDTKQFASRVFEDTDPQKLRSLERWYASSEATKKIPETIRKARLQIVAGQLDYLVRAGIWSGLSS
jgi:hypothetical protein